MLPLRAREKLYVTTARSRMLYGVPNTCRYPGLSKKYRRENLEEIGGSVHGDAGAYGMSQPSQFERQLVEPMTGPSPEQPPEQQV